MRERSEVDQQAVQYIYRLDSGLDYTGREA